MISDKTPSPHYTGGDLVSDTITIVGGALDLQVKTAKEAMTPIEDVFMLPIDAKLDYETLAMVVRSGHSRVPVFEEVEIPVLAAGGKEKRKVKRIKGILLVKQVGDSIILQSIHADVAHFQCVLLDPEGE
jgi:metal transporter CNNM